MFYIILVVILCVFIPVIGLPLSFPLYLKAKNTRQKIVTSVLLGLLVGIFAFYFTPREDFDLIFHRNVVEKYIAADSITDFNIISENIDLEIIPRMLSFFVSKFDNVNILQFLVSLIGFSSIFYVLVDYKNRIGLSNIKFIPLFLLGLFGQPIIFYFSGLYCYLAISILALAIYLDYVKKIKIAPYLLYALVLLIHNSMAFPVAYIVLFKILGNRFNVKFLVVSILGAIFITFVLSFLVNDMGISFLGGIEETFEKYMSRNSSFQNIYTGAILVLDVIKLIFTILVSAIIVKKKDESLSAVAAFILVFSIVIAILSARSIVMTRFISLVFYFSIVLAMQLIKNGTKISWFILIASYIFAITLSVYNIFAIHRYGYDGFIGNNLNKNITNILRSRDLYVE